MNITEIAVNASCFHDTSPIEATQTLARMGVRKVEFAGTPVKALSESALGDLRSTMDCEGVTCISLNAVGDLVPVNLGNLAAQQERERSAAVAHVKRLIEIAAILESDVVVCDAGTTTEDVAGADEQAREREGEAYLDSCLELLDVADPAGVSLVLQPVPGRRWIPWDGYPPDRSPVVERHVWPWRRWFENDEIVEGVERRLEKRVGWAVDVANEVVAAGCCPVDIPARISYFMERNLQRVYLANHPGPYNKVWHRLLRHQNLCDGFLTPSDFGAVLTHLHHGGFAGEIVLLICEEEPSPEKLRRSLCMLSEAGRGRLPGKEPEENGNSIS